MLVTRRSFSGLVTASVLSLPFSANAQGMEQVSTQEAHAIAVEAYLYLYSLVTMDLTRRQLTNAGPDALSVCAPMNGFSNLASYPAADMKVVVRPNFDTLYSSAWLDLSREPLVVSVPDTHGRYCLLPMLDMWTDVFASPGWRTTGTQAANYLLTSPGWRGRTPDGMTRINAPTPYVWIIGRIQTNGPADYDAVHAIQSGLRIKPLSGWGGPPLTPMEHYDRSVDMKTPPKLQVDKMTADQFFGYAAEVLKFQPPHLTDQPIIARMQRIGFFPGRSFDLDSAPSSLRNALETAPKDAQTLMAWKLKTLSNVVNGWSMNTDTMGVYGDYYLKRAIVTQLGLGANLPEDAIYPANLADNTGQPLNGTNNYTIHFDKGALPPVEAFWSLTLYDNDGYQVPNSLNRFAISSWMPLKYNADGSLDLFIQNADPGGDKSADWLPAPKGPFNVLMRLYAPRSDALTGKWAPPPVMKQAAS